MLNDDRRLFSLVCAFSLSASVAAAAASMFMPDTRLNVRLGTQKVRLAVRSVATYRDRLFRRGRIFDGRKVIPFMAIADQDEQSPSSTLKNTFVSPSVRGYLIYDLVSDRIQTLRQ